MSNKDYSSNIYTLSIHTSGNIDPRYKDVPMDLNSSPLQDYFEQSLLLDNTIEAAVPPSITSNNGKTMPVLIPRLSNSTTHHEKKKKHSKQQRKPVPHTFPDDGLEAVMERRLQQTQRNTAGITQSNKGKNSQSFTVGSLQEKPPVPWPTNLTTPESSRRLRLANRQTVNWPLVPEHSRRYQASNEDEDDIFNMENDFYYNSSDFDEEADLDDFTAIGST